LGKKYCHKKLKKPDRLTMNNIHNNNNNLPATVNRRSGRRRMTDNDFPPFYNLTKQINNNSTCMRMLIANRDSDEHRVHPAYLNFFAKWIQRV
jgi:hypothetical protein